MCKSSNIFGLNMPKMLFSNTYTMKFHCTYRDSSLYKCFVNLLAGPIILHLGLFVINDNALSKHGCDTQPGNHSTLQLCDFSVQSTSFLTHICSLKRSSDHLQGILCRFWSVNDVAYTVGILWLTPRRLNPEITTEDELKRCSKVFQMQWHFQWNVDKYTLKPTQWYL